jgi:enamine deaminase RidA (YjgF/YER057c/UK114 family)
MKRKYLCILCIIIVALLTFFCFKINAPVIEKELINKVKNIEFKNGFSDINVTLKGKGFTLTRTIILSGEVKNSFEKQKAISLAYKVNGVKYVIDNLKIKKIVPKSYYIAVVKDKNNTIYISGQINKNEESNLKNIFNLSNYDLKFFLQKKENLDSLDKKVFKNIKKIINEIEYGTILISNKEIIIDATVANEDLKTKIVNEILNNYNKDYYLDIKIKTLQELIIKNYFFKALKGRDGNLKVLGFVDNSKEFQNIKSYIDALYLDNVKKYDFKAFKGAPKYWSNTIKIGLVALKEVEFGEFELKKNKFIFKGFVFTKEHKNKLLTFFNNTIDALYDKEIFIKTPNLKFLKNKQIHSILKKRK